MSGAEWDARAAALRPEERETLARMSEAAEAGAQGWNLRCNVCGVFGADWLPDLRPGWGCLAACPACAARISAETARHREAMAVLTRVSFEQPHDPRIEELALHRPGRAR